MTKDHWKSLICRVLILQETFFGDKLFIGSKLMSSVMELVPKWISNARKASFPIFRLGRKVFGVVLVFWESEDGNNGNLMYAFVIYNRRFLKSSTYVSSTCGTDIVAGTTHGRLLCRRAW